MSFSGKFVKQLLIISYIEDLRGEMMVPPAKKLEDLIHLAELCVDLLQQNEEHYAEVSLNEHLSLPKITVL